MAESGENIIEDKDSQSLNILINVSPDNMTAYLTVIAASMDATISEAEIRDRLKKKGIVFGIQEDVLQKIIDEKYYNMELIIAQGQPIELGRDASINHKIEKGKRLKIEKNEVVAEYIPSEPGTDGITVFGKPLKAKKVRSLPRPSHSFLEPFSDEEDSYAVSEKGFITLEENDELHFEPAYKLEISSDELSVFITAASPEHPDDMDSKDIYQLLEENKITFGILEENIERIFEEQKYNEKIVIAKGNAAKDGKNGSLKLNFEPEVKPFMDEHGRIDYKRLNLVQNVKKGDVLAEISPPTEGMNGETIKGHEIPARPGKPELMPPGLNTEIEVSDPNIMKTSIDGRVAMKGKSIVVDPVFVVERNVDYETGNIDFIGSVIIKGDVKNGFEVKALNDVQVEGVVENAIIEAGGSVLVKGGFLGRGQGKIKAGKDIMVRFCENQCLESHGSIKFGEYIMHCTVSSQGMVQVLQEKGLIIGGDIFARDGVEAKNIGNNQYAPTNITVGLDPELMKKIKDVNAAILKCDEDVSQLAKNIRKITERQLPDSAMRPEVKNIAEKMIEAQNVINKRKIKYTEELQQYKEEMKEFQNAKVKVLEVIYPGVVIFIQNYKYNIQEELEHAYFSLGIDEVLANDLDKLNK